VTNDETRDTIQSLVLRFIGRDECDDKLLAAIQVLPFWDAMLAYRLIAKNGKGTELFRERVIANQIARKFFIEHRAKFGDDFKEQMKARAIEIGLAV
jgi:hypothetical protein